MVAEGQKPDAESAHAWEGKGWRERWRDERKSGRTEGGAYAGKEEETETGPRHVQQYGSLHEHATASVCARVSSYLNVFAHELIHLFHARNLGFVSQRFALLLRPHHISLDFVRPVKIDLELSLGV